MTTITTRSGKGSPLTNDEVDANFTNLNDDKVEASGDSMTGDLSFGDNNKAIFGDSSDLQIYHDGSGSYIQDTGQGYLYISASNQLRLTNADATEEYIRATVNGAVDIKYDNATKLSTTSTGIDVTGTIVGDGLTVDTAIATSTASFRATTNSTTIGQKIGSLDFFNGTTNAAGTLEVRRASGGNAYSDMALMASANGNRSNQLLLSTNGDISFYDTDGTTASFVYDASAGLTINQAGADRDFRVESDSNTHMLFVDAGNNYVGIGDSTPEATLHVEMSGGVVDSVNKALIVQANTASAILGNGGTGVVLRGKSSGGNIANYEQAMMASYGYASNNQHGISFWTKPNGSTNLTQKMRLEADGQMVMQRGAIFNTESVSDNNADFQVKSDSNTQALLVDAGGDFVAFGNTIKNPASGFSDQHGVGIDALTGSVQIASDAQPLEINRTTTGGANGGFITFRQEGTSTYSMGMDTQGLVFNEGGSDKDFRVESSSYPNMFRVDAGTDAVAVRLSTSEPANVLDVNGDISFTRTVSKKVSTGAANANYFVIYEKDFETSAFTTNQHWVRITGAGSTNGAHVSAEFYITFKQQGTGKYFNIVPIENTGLTIGYTYDASGGASSAGKLKIFASSEAGFYTYIQVFATARDGNSDDAIARGTFPMTDTGSGTAPAGMTTMAFPLNYGANKYQLSGYASSAFVINEDSNDLDFRVESDTSTHALFVDAGNNAVGIGSSDPSANQFKVGIAANFVTTTGTTPFNITRTGGTDQALQIYVDDTNVYFDSVQDEVGLASGGYYFRSSNGTNDNQNLLIMNQTGTTFNENSLDADFRVESNAYTHMLFVDAGNDNVGIKLSAPQSAFHINENGGPQSSGDMTTGLIVSNGTVGTAIQMGTNDASGFGFIKSAYVNSSETARALLLYTGTTKAVSLETSETVINDDSLDRDFRVESDSNTHALFVNAGTDSVGIQIASPNENLHIHEESSEAAGIAFTNNTSGTTSGDGGFVGLGSGEQMYLWNREANSVILGSNNDTRLEIDQYGNIAARFNDTTDFFSLGGTNLVNGVTAKPSNAGTPLALARDTGTLRSAHFAGHLKFDSGYGVDFGISSGGGASSTVLDDYEEGDKTATSVVGITATTNTVTGVYTKIGNVVIEHIIVTISGKTGGTGNPYVPLSFTPSGDQPPAKLQGGSIGKDTVVGTTGNFMSIYGNGAQVYMNNKSGSYIGNANWTDGELCFTVIYTTP